MHERILVIKLDAAGDVLRSTSILPAFKKENPNLSIWWITENSSKNYTQTHEFIKFYNEREYIVH